MKNLKLLDQYRVRPGSPEYPANLEDTIVDEEKEGWFSVPSVYYGGKLAVCVATGYDWEHVSVSHNDRIPLWMEMQQVKSMFFLPHEWVLQFHPSDAEYITGRWPGGRALNVLHLWRPIKQPIPMPPRWMVGANSAEDHKRMLRLSNVEIRKATQCGFCNVKLTIPVCPRCGFDQADIKPKDRQHRRKVHDGEPQTNRPVAAGGEGTDPTTGS